MTPEGFDENANHHLQPLGLICGGDGTPLGETWIDLSSPNQVLYGLNGAGKTTVLEAFKGALTGRGHCGRILAHLPYSDQWATNGLWWEVAEMLTGHYLGIDDGDPDSFTGSLEATLLAEHERRQMAGNGPAWGFDELDWRPLLSAMAATSAWLFTGTGAGWRASPVVLMDPSGGEWHEHLRFLVDLLNDHDGPLPQEVGLEPMWWDESAPDGAPIGIIGSSIVRQTRRSTMGNPWWPFGLVVTDESEDESTLTRNHLIAQRDYVGGFESDGSVRREPLQLDDKLRGRADDIQARANTILSTLLADAPALKLELGDELAWFAGRSCTWSATRFGGDQPLGLSALSSAEHRWASVALRLALANLTEGEPDPVLAIAAHLDDDVSSLPRPTRRAIWLLLDEPERGLHRTAESHMARGIQGLTSSGVRSFVATHSPELLDAQTAEVNYVRRRARDRSGAVVPMGAFEDVRSDLGLNPSDMLRRTRGIALVEGEHDLQVLQGAIGNDLEALGVRLLATRGGRRLKTVVDSQFLYEFTDAVLFPILDDLTLEPVVELWQRVNLAARTRPTSEVIDELRDELGSQPGKGREFLEQFLTKSLQNGTFERVQPLGIPQTDVLLCLPVNQFVPDVESWEQLREEARRTRGQDEVSETEFKEFLMKRKKGRADLSLENIRRIAEVSSPHPDVTALLAAMAERLSR